MHAVERSFQEFRRRSGSVLDAAERSYRAEALKFGEDVGQVVLSYRALTYAMGRPPTADALIERVLFATALQAWAAYRATKQIYSFDPTLAEALEHATWPEALDVSTLFLPVNGCVLALSEQASDYYAAFYDYATGDAPSLQLKIRIAQLDVHASRVYPMGGVALRGGTLQRALEAERESDRQFVLRRLAREPADETSRYLARGMASYDKELDQRALVLRKVLNAVLYINGNHDVVRAVHPGGRDRNGDGGQPGPRRERRARDLAKPGVCRVGSEFGAAIAHWEREAARQEQAADGGGWSVRPHLRRAHLHLYWTGPGRGVPRFRLVLPTVVGDRRSEEAGETVRPVR